MAQYQHSLILVLSWAVCLSYGSHFRGMTVNFKPTDDSGSGEMEVCHDIAWELGTSQAKCTAVGQEAGENRFFVCKKIPDGERDKEGCPAAGSLSMKYTCETIFRNDWALGGKCSVVTFDLTQAEKFYISDGVPCCWVTLAEGGGNIEARMMMDLRTRTDTGKINNSPRATLSGLRRIQKDCEFSMKIPFQDEDSDTVRCRFAIGTDECGGVCGALENVGFKLDEERCFLKWNATVSGRIAAAVMIEDFDADNELLSSIPLQFLIEVFTSDDPCQTPTVEPKDVCFVIKPGATFEEDIVATPISDPISANVAKITEIVFTARPDTMTIGSLVDDSKVTVTWTPTPAEYRSHFLCYFAVDENGVQSPVECVTLKAGVTDDLPEIKEFAPDNDELLPRIKEELTIKFTGPVAIPTLDIKSVRVHEFDTDALTEKIDVTASSSQVTLLDGNERADITITALLFPQRKYYVLVDNGAFIAFEDCAGQQAPVPGISDKNEWTFIADPCGLTDNCHEKADCTNTVGNPLGSFRCDCKTGYSGDGVVECDNINECDPPTHECVINADCVDTNGSYQCPCADGYSGDGRNGCKNIDECKLEIDNCDIDERAECKDTEGSFMCTCKPGYTEDGVDCKDIDECADKDNCHKYANCSNTDGSFECTCKAGYTGDGKLSCVDIDECALMLHDCTDDEKCINTKGSFLCGCDEGFFFDGGDCVDNCTAGWPYIRDMYLSNNSDWQNLTENCPDANLTEPPVITDEPPIKQWQKLLDHFLKDYAAWLDVIRNLISGVPVLPDIDPKSSPEEVWDILYDVHKMAQDAWQEQVGDPNGITFPDPFADCDDERRRKWLISASTTEESVDKYREVFDDRCDA